MIERSWWGWGDERSAIRGSERLALGSLVIARLGGSLPDPVDPPSVDEVSLHSPRVEAPGSLRSLLTVDPRERALHARGRSFRDVVRNLSGDMSTAPDYVALPASETDIVAVLDWAADARLAVVPFGGGSSVVGGVEADVGDAYRGAVSLDMRNLNRVLDVDGTSLAARVEAGALGPHIDEQLRPHGLTLRHQPQSFEYSTLGGWIATRSAGHYSTVRTRIDDLVEALRVVTPAGVVETARFPSSGAGPDPNRMFLGSEGTLGVITEAWVRVQRPPRFRASTAPRFSSFGAGLAALRALAQAALHPAVARLLDPAEALLGGVGDGSHAVMLISFESADTARAAWLADAVQIVRDHGGQVDAAERTSSPDAASTWRAGFVRLPYVRDALTSFGLIVETFESATTWDRIDALLDGVQSAIQTAFSELGAQGMVTCRITHVYPDGAAPYWTVIARGDPARQVTQWDEVKAAVSRAIAQHGGTITHHHAVGRDHRQWYDAEAPPLYVESLRSAKRIYDPAGILNPGVLFDP